MSSGAMGAGPSGSVGAAMSSPPPGSSQGHLQHASPDLHGGVQWTKHLSADVGRQLHAIYGDHFPLEVSEFSHHHRHHCVMNECLFFFLSKVRQVLAGWLEATFTGPEELDPVGNPHHEEHARVLVGSLVQQLQMKANEATDFALKAKLEQIVEHFKVSRSPARPLVIIIFFETTLRPIKERTESFLPVSHWPLFTTGHRRAS